MIDFQPSGMLYFVIKINTIIWPQDGKIHLSPDRKQEQETTVPRAVFHFFFIYFIDRLLSDTYD